MLHYLPGNLLVRDYAGSVLAAWHKPRHIQEQGNVNCGIASIRLACRQFCWDFFLISDWCGNTHLIVGVDTPEFVVLGCIRNLTEQAIDSKQVSKIPPWPWFQVLPPGSYLKLLPGLCKVYWSSGERNTFLSEMFLVMIFITAVESKLEQGLLSCIYKVFPSHSLPHIRWLTDGNCYFARGRSWGLER